MFGTRHAEAGRGRWWCGRPVGGLVILMLLLLGACGDPAPEPPPFDPGERGRPIEGAGTRVLVVANARSVPSRRLAERYVSARRVPPSHVIVLDLPRSESMSRADFDLLLLDPLIRWWGNRPPEDRPLYLLLMKGVPLRVQGRSGRDGDLASVDSELALLPRRAANRPTPTDGPMVNPYRTRGPVYPPFDPDASLMCLVTRLDGFTEADAMAVLERGLHPPAEPDSGRFVIDLRGGDRGRGELALLRAATVVSEMGATARLDTTETFIARARRVMGYASWGSNDVRYERGFDFEWLDGAVAATFVSSSARTFEEPPPGWSPGRARETDRYHGGTPQSLIGDLIRSGVSGVSGNVDEPWLDGSVRPDVLFGAYLSGRNLAESFYLAMPYLSWRGLVVGDPLCRIRPLSSESGHTQ